MLLLTNQHPVKNPVWEVYTPNEMWDNDALALAHLKASYRMLELPWARAHGIPGKKRWFEMRVNSNRTLLNITARQRWWDAPEFMDKIFWVYQTPILFNMDGETVSCYPLEFMECQRVKAVGIRRFGRNPFSSEVPSLLIPQDCCELAWKETANGYSEHLRHRPEHEPTQEELDREATAQEAVEKAKERIFDIPSDKMDRVLGSSVQGSGENVT